MILEILMTLWAILRVDMETPLDEEEITEIDFKVKELFTV